MVTFNQDRGPCLEQRPQKLRQNEDIQDYLFNAVEPAVGVFVCWEINNNV